MIEIKIQIDGVEKYVCPANTHLVANLDADIRRHLDMEPQEYQFAESWWTVRQLMLAGF